MDLNHYNVIVENANVRRISLVKNVKNARMVSILKVSPIALVNIKIKCLYGHFIKGTFAVYKFSI